MEPPILKHRIITAIAIAIGGQITGSGSNIGEVVILCVTTVGITVDFEGAIDLVTAIEYDDVGDRVTIELGVLVVHGSISITVERLEITVASWYGISCCVIMGVRMS